MGQAPPLDELAARKRLAQARMELHRAEMAQGAHGGICGRSASVAWAARCHDGRFARQCCHRANYSHERAVADLHMSTRPIHTPMRIQPHYQQQTPIAHPGMTVPPSHHMSLAADRAAWPREAGRAGPSKLLVPTS